MPYKNPYNAGIAKQVRTLSQKHVAREKEINDFATDYEIPSQLESSVLHNPEVHGGSGFGAATVADLGFDPTIGATTGEAKPKRRAKKKVIEVGEGLSAAGVSLRRAYREQVYRAERCSVFGIWTRCTGSQRKPSGQRLRFRQSRKTRQLRPEVRHRQEP